MAIMASPSPHGLFMAVTASTDILPSVSSLISSTWRSPYGALVGLRGRQAEEAESKRHAMTRSSAKELQRVELPECLRSASVENLMYRSSSTGMAYRQTLPSTVYLMSPTPRTFDSTRLSRSLSEQFRRSFSSSFKPSGFVSIRTASLGYNQHRALSTGTNSSQNLLAHMEQTANNNPQSATAQNAFYQALLRANMSEIVAERYQTGRYASNAACEAAYIRALERIGQTEKGLGYPAGAGALSQGNSFDTEQLQAIGQAVAAQSRGGNIAMARGKGGATQGNGAKDSPLYVVVEESVGGTIFKWAKFLFYFGLAAYCSLVIITVAIETTGLLKKVGSTQNNEAQAQHQTVRFSDVHGCEEAKEELQELVEFLKSPEDFSTLGGKLPKGVLLVGPPGTGKTLLARAVAGEAGVPFFFMSGSEFDEVYVGVGAKRVRELFSAARAKSPAIIFLDELDAVGGKRNERDAAYAKQTLNQLLTELDGFSQESGVIVLAATNFPQLLDKALTRPGRFDRNVVVPLPDVRGRVAILQHHMKKIQVGTDVDAAVLARGTPGFSGAELENVINQAAVHASKNKAKKVSMMDFEWSRDKIMMGAERKSAIIQQKDRLMTAYHEGGHALVAMFTAGADPLYKATIMPRGQALGITYQLPEIDRVSQAKLELRAQIDICMGGKVAEELIYGADRVTSGASSDIQKATQVAYAMVTQLGMSEELGNIDLATDYARLSSETKQRIENEVRRLVEDGRERAMKLLTEKRHELDALAKALVEYETLNKEEMEKVVRGEKLKGKMVAVPNLGLPQVVDVLGKIAPGFGTTGETASGVEKKSS